MLPKNSKIVSQITHTGGKRSKLGPHIEIVKLESSGKLVDEDDQKIVQKTSTLLKGPSILDEFDENSRSITGMLNGDTNRNFEVRETDDLLDKADSEQQSTLLLVQKSLQLSRRQPSEKSNDETNSIGRNDTQLDLAKLMQLPINEIAEN